MKLMTVIGARPQFVKAAAVSRAISKHNKSAGELDGIMEIIVHTGQHFDRNMSDVFFEEMKIPRPDYFLDIHSLSHGAMTGQMLEKIEELILKERPDFVLVYGDTNTTLAGALAAVKLHVPVVHVEAGLRSFNRRMPEEINRVVADHVASILMCPTRAAVENLVIEGIVDQPFQPGGIRVVNFGDVMLDAAIFYSQHAPPLNEAVKDEPMIADIADIPFALATVHRADNTDDPERLKGIFAGLAAIGKTTPVVMPLHPRTRAKLKDAGIETESFYPEIRIIKPLGYLSMLSLLTGCKLVLTDSGGLQKEAFFFKTPCVTLRRETEWVELCELGANLLAGTSPEKIHESALSMLEKSPDFSSLPYGEGLAADNMVKFLAGLDAPSFFARPDAKDFP